MKNNKKGFTLVELLAVIVILGILLLVAVPGIQSILSNARKRTFTSNLALAANSIKTNISVLEQKDCYVYVNGNEGATDGKIELERGSLDGITAVFYVDAEKEVWLLHGVDKANGMTLGSSAAINESTDPDGKKRISIGSGEIKLLDITKKASDVATHDPDDLEDIASLGTVGNSNRCAM